MKRGMYPRQGRSRYFFASVILSFACSVFPRCASADVIIFDNLNTADAPLDVKLNQWDAQSFTVGASSVQLSLTELNLATAEDASGSFFLRLYSNSGTNMPAALLETLSGSSNPAAAGIYSYTGSTLLSANTSYWIVAGVSAGPGNYKWNFELPANVEIGQQVGSVLSFDQGQSWFQLGTGAPELTFNMRVSGVPEPSTIALTAIGLAAMTFLVRKRTKSMQRV